jgi:hypothetical protein
MHISRRPPGLGPVVPVMPGSFSTRSSRVQLARAKTTRRGWLPSSWPMPASRVMVLRLRLRLLVDVSHARALVTTLVACEVQLRRADWVHCGWTNHQKCRPIVSRREAEMATGGRQPDLRSSVSSQTPPCHLAPLPTTWSALPTQRWTTLQALHHADIPAFGSLAPFFLSCATPFFSLRRSTPLRQPMKAEATLDFSF